MGFVSEFRDLRVYQAARAAATEIFEVSKGFPKHERFLLTAQIRRSSRSVPANIAEAWRKRRYPGSFVAKLSDADAEAAETRAHLDTGLGCEYLSSGEHARLDALYARITRQLVRLMNQAPRWAPERPSARQAGEARPTPDPPTSVRDRSGKKEGRDDEPAASSHPIGPNGAGNETSHGHRRSSGNEGRP